MRMFLVATAIGMAGLSACSFGQELHGPICSWHLDPTTTMNIQWIEKVHAETIDGQWFVGTAGFGYGDDDDTTRLDMQQKHQVLYVRKEFDLRALPTERPITVFGGWTAMAKRQQGSEIKHNFTISYEFQARRNTGEVKQGEREGIRFSKLDVAGKSVEFEYKLEVDGTERNIRIAAEASGDRNEKLIGKWEAIDEHGTSVESGPWTADLTEPPSFGGGGRGGRRGGRGGGGRGGDANLKLVLRVRYDDGFIAYLNGVEIVRANVEKGAGESATGIKGHDAETEEEFTVDEAELVKLLKRGKNVLSIEGHNNALDSSDFTLDPEFGYMAFGRYRSLVDKKADWQYLLGKPAEDWTTAEVNAVRADGVSPTASKFELRYGKRGQPLANTISVNRRLFADTGNVIHQALLTELEPDTGYAFELKQAETLNGRVQRHFFRTAPADDKKPVTFVTGGDMYGTRAKLDAMNSEAGRREATFALLGGDLAYANGKDANRWYDWVDSWARFAITPNDYCLPMIAVIGNHECSKNLDEVAEGERREFDPTKSAKFYLSLFPLPQGKTNFVIDFGGYMSIVCLDSYHTQTPESQVPWLEETLHLRTTCPNLFVCYHRPAFGTLVKDDIEDIRKYWAPIFENYGVDAVFENDHHIYKRTLPLLGGKMHPDGVAYIGDGAWGVETREIPWDRTRRLGYIVRGESKNHLIRVTIEKDYQSFDAFTADGLPLDNHIRVRKSQGVLVGAAN